MTNDPQYNWVYKELVKGSDDVRGALAYVLYKNSKIAYIDSFLSSNSRQPNAAELAEFHRMTSLSETLEGYRERADVLLETFLDNVLAEQLAAFKAEIRFDAAINAVKPSFKSGVWQNIVAGLVTTMITFGFVLCAWMYSEGPTKILTGAAYKMFGTDVQASGTQPQASSTTSKN